MNLEGRIQKAERAIKPLFESKPASVMLSEIASAARKPLFNSARQREQEIERILTRHTTRSWPGEYLEVRPAALERDSAYPIMLVIGDDPHHRGYLTERASSLVKFCSDAYIEVSPELAEKYKVDDGDAVRVESEFGKLMAPVRVSRVLEGNVVFLPRNFSATRANSLVSRRARVDWVKINKVSG